MNELSTIQQSEPSVALLMERAISAGITPQSVEVIERLVALQERNQARSAEQEFARAFAELQKEMPRIQAIKAVDQKADGTCRYRFAPYEEIMRQARPLLSQHGFSVSFDTEWQEARIMVSCKLLHKGGHFQTNRFAARVGKGPPGTNEAQADMAVKTLAKRGALCDALNIVVEHDTDGDDARIEGAAINSEQASELDYLIREIQPDLQKLLEWANAKSVKEIASSRFEDVRSMLLRKKKRKTVENPKATDPDQPWG
jgi:hypothetical protein